ncbi:hypothetical protein BJX62DRAFT_152246 [Aspergillus germanicus]
MIAFDFQTACLVLSSDLGPTISAVAVPEWFAEAHSTAAITSDPLFSQATKPDRFCQEGRAIPDSLLSNSPWGWNPDRYPGSMCDTGLCHAQWGPSVQEVESTHFLWRITSAPRARVPFLRGSMIHHTLRQSVFGDDRKATGTSSRDSQMLGMEFVPDTSFRSSSITRESSLLARNTGWRLRGVEDSLSQPIFWLEESGFSDARTNSQLFWMSLIV